MKYSLHLSPFILPSPNPGQSVRYQLYGSKFILSSPPQGKVYVTNFMDQNYGTRGLCESPYIQQQHGEDGGSHLTGNYLFNISSLFLLVVHWKKEKHGRMLLGICWFILWIKSARINFLKITATHSIQAVLCASCPCCLLSLSSPLPIFN